MEVVAATPGGGGVPPFHDHDVHEWSRIDSLTGVLERARLETDHWSANTNNSCHKYGKVVDSRARTDADGALQQKARRQLEVYQSQIPGGHLQVIKSHTVSSSRWSSNKSTDAHRDTTKDFENLELSLNSLDLSSQKSKANVGRSVGRRPPSRPRARDESSTTNPLRNAQQTAATNLYRVSRLCHQLHEDTVKQTFGKYYQPPKSKLQNGNGGSSGGVEIYEIESVSSDNNEPSTNGHHPNLLRTKSTSSEDLLLTPEKDKSNKSTEDLEDLEQLQNWRRSSKVRRSLQYPAKPTKQVTPSRPIDLPESNGSVRKIREELEKGRRLSAALRGNNVDLEALDQILQSISSSSDRASPLDDSQYDLEQELQTLGKKQKRNSFVTVETLQEVKGRLRHTNTEDVLQSKPEEIDDGVVTEDNNESKNEMSKVRTYVYGMESMLNKKPVSGTGSLESRSKALNSNVGLRNEDWYNRRKSYGFEQVYNQNETSNSISLRTKGRVESSTDSGICKSSEMVPNTPNKISTPRKFTYESDDTNTYNSVKKISTIFDKGLNKENNYAYSWDKNYPKSTTITIPIVAEPKPEWKPDVEIKRHSIAVDESKYVTNHNNDNNKFRRTSLAINDRLSDLDDPSNQNRRSKKVEFCKTEVHFAAESGKVNIVETDEKPPPTHNFRRRRRNSGPIGDGNDLLLGESRNDLPVLHFGDSSYEKSLLGVKSDDGYSGDAAEKITVDENIYENLQHKTVPCGTVTVNTNALSEVRENEKKEFFIENDSIKGILKNKPIKPTPYHLGENKTFLLNHGSDKDTNKWGVKLKPVGKVEPPYWKSTVTLSNTVYGNEAAVNNENLTNGKNPSEFQILLKNLKPTNSAKPDLIENQDRMSPAIKFVTSEDNRPPWSVADKVKLSEKQWNENKTYSTKINFGDGGTAVIENDDLKRKQLDALWPKRKSPVKDSKQMLSKGLVVRIGKEDSKHAVCSKTTSQKLCNTTTTTTKITIDLNSPVLNSKLKESQTIPADSKSHSFKSTSLILNTIKNDTNKEDVMRIPHQLEALKKLYENVHSDSDADEEVQKLMEKMEEKQSDHVQVDNSSVLSGSWSKMRAYKSITEHFNKSSLTHVNKSANVEKDSVVFNDPGSYGYDTSNSTRFNKTTKTKDTKKSEMKSSLLTSSYNNSSLSKKLDLKTATVGEKLSSPSLVGKNSKVDLFVDSPAFKKESEFANISDIEMQRRHVQKDIVLRQPKKSEMTYFGINISPKQDKIKKSETVIHSESSLTEKPDLLQHMKIDESRYNNKTKPRKNSPTNALSHKVSPIYENLINSKPNKTKNGYSSSREFDSNILNELTLAADQILKAVNDFAEEDSKKQSRDTKKTHLDTISERKSWTQDKKIKKTAASYKPLVKSKLNHHHSSTSSVESISRDDEMLSSPARNHSQTNKLGSTDKIKKKPISSDSSSTKVNMKARRLQRASSREALLQSRGSSSEDLGGNVVNPQRKPRQIKKTKSVQMTFTNGVELNKKASQIPNPPTRRRKEDIVKGSSKERTTEALPEVRHKTAVSTIKSTTEKSSREHISKPRISELKRKVVTQDKKENHSKGLSLSSRTDPGKDAVTRETVNHRISTANIKKCHRTERSTKH